MKKLFIIALGVLSLQANNQEDGFALINQSERPIWIDVVNTEDIDTISKKGSMKLEPDDGIVWEHNTNEPTYLAAFYSEPPIIRYNWDADSVTKLWQKPVPNKVYSFTQGKTIFLIWDKASFARPLSKEVMEKRAKLTGVNFNLQNNVTAEDIKEHAPGA